MGMFRPNYNQNGPGVSKNEPKKKGFFLFWDIYFRKFWHLIQLNIIFVLACCTVVFIGPALAGMSYVLRNFSQEKHAFVWEDFLDTAKKNLKQSMLVGFINAVLFVLLGIAVWFWYSAYSQQSSLMFSLPLVVCIAGLVFLLFMHYYMYLMLVTFDISIKKLYKNSLILAFYALPRNILITFVILLASLFVFTIPSAGQLAITILGFFFIIFLYFGFVGLATVSMSYPIIKRVMIDPYKENNIANAPVVSDDTEDPEIQEESIFSDEQIDTPVQTDYIPPADKPDEK